MSRKNKISHSHPTKRISRLHRNRQKSKFSRRALVAGLMPVGIYSAISFSFQHCRTSPLNVLRHKMHLEFAEPAVNLGSEESDVSKSMFNFGPIKNLTFNFFLGFFVSYSAIVLSNYCSEIMHNCCASHPF